MNKITKIQIAIGILLVAFSIAGMLYNYYVEIYLLNYPSWSHSNYTTALALPLLYFGGTYVLYLVTVGELSNVENIDLKNKNHSRVREFINKPAFVKLFLLVICYIGFATFGWVAISDALYLISKHA